MLEKLKKYKLILILGGIGVLILLVFILLFQEKSTPTAVDKNFPILSPYPTTTEEIVPSPVPTFSADQLQAIEDQKKADETVGDREIEIKTTYPWFIKLPLRADKYFVYFETDRKVFVGLLYPKAGDNVEQMKATVRSQLVDLIKVPKQDFERYVIEWKITPE